MQEQIIDFLNRSQDYVSGDQLSHRLKISRQALWKHIQDLKAKGYEIVAVPHLGYRLESSPDRLFAFSIASNLKTQFIGKKIYYFETLPSTMDTAIQLGLKGEPEGALIVAEGQNKGRGRLGREWVSPKHKGIYISLILRPKLSPSEASILTLLAAVSICEAVKEITEIDAQIKWPNDILLNGKKLGGILTELSAEMDEVRFLVIGIGLNVNNDRKALVSGAVSLREFKREEVSRVSLLQEILRCFELNYLNLQKKGSGSVIEKWRRHNVTLSKRVKVHAHKERIEGVAVDIDTDGGLLVRTDSGTVEKVMSGELLHCG